MWHVNLVMITCLCSATIWQQIWLTCTEGHTHTHTHTPETVLIWRCCRDTSNINPLISPTFPGWLISKLIYSKSDKPDFLFLSLSHRCTCTDPNGSQSPHCDICFPFELFRCIWILTVFLCLVGCMWQAPRQFVQQAGACYASKDSEVCESLWV